MKSNAATVRHLFLLTMIVVSATVGVGCDATSPTGASPGGRDHIGTGIMSDADAGGDASSSGGRGDTTLPKPGQLTAGRWSDLENWTFWMDLLGTSQWSDAVTHWGLNARSVIVANIRNGGRAVTDAEVTLLDGGGNKLWGARSDNHGTAYLFPSILQQSAGPYTITAAYDGASTSVQTQATASRTDCWLTLQPRRGSTDVDIMFMVDATGSMGDEMSYIQSELRDVIQRVRDMNSEDLRFRLSCNVYRDEGDDYVVRAFPFTTDINEATARLAEQEANGGGDYEEAVESALDNAVNQHQWSTSARARILFLVLDAPPHYTPDRLAVIHAATKAAAGKGIRIVPIAASGIDKNTEFLLRLTAIATGGAYVFLTNDSGIGDSHIAPTVGPYAVHHLNDLLVSVINGYVGG